MQKFTKTIFQDDESNPDSTWYAIIWIHTGNDESKAIFDIAEGSHLAVSNWANDKLKVLNAPISNN